VTTNCPWKLLDYWQMTKRPDLGDFVVRGRADAAEPLAATS
jgi:hypothetical protein